MAQLTPPRRWRRPLIVAAAGLALASGAYALLGPAAPAIIDHFADGQRVWRLGRIDVDGVSGSWLGGLRAERITIADDQGVWIEATDVALDWRPQNLIFGGVDIDAGRAGAIIVLRQPALSAPRPSSGASFDVRLDAIEIQTLSLAEPVLGEAATFRATFALLLEGQQLNGLDLELRRTDSDADRAIVHYRPDAPYRLEADIEGAPGGIIARALGAPEARVRATAQGEGDAQSGQARFDARIGESALLDGETQWTPTQWSLRAQGQLDALPSLREIAERAGPSVALNAAGARVGPFTVHAETPFLSLDLEGAFNAERELEGPARFAATTARLSDIARESPFTLGAARLEGELRRARGTTAIRATLDAREIDALGQSVRLTGPVNAALTPERFGLEADLSAPEGAPPLFAGARLQTDLHYNRSRRRFELTTARLSGEALDLDAQGWVNGGDGEFAGAWRVRRLQALAPDLAGAAGGRWRAFAEQAGENRIWTAVIDGAGSEIAGAPAIVPQVLGRTPRLDARLSFENGGVTVQHARIDGMRARAGASGRIVGGQANLALEASARGPIALGGAEIAGAADATGTITGRIARPTISARANLSSFAAGGVVVAQPSVDFTLAPTRSGYTGRAAVQGQALNQPLAASANVSVDDGGFALNDLDAALGALSAQGQARFTSAGASAELALSGALDGLAPGVSGRIEGNLALTPAALQLDAQIADARAGDLRVRAATLRAEGPFERIAAEFDMRGRLRDAPLSFAGTGTLDLDGGAELSIDGRGQLAGADVFTRAPIQAQWESEGVTASLNVAIGDGVVSGAWRERGRSVSGTASIEDAPLAPLAAIWGETATGRIDGRVRLASQGAGLSGDVDLQFDDARFAGRQRGALDLRIVGDLEPSRLAATIDATSSDGLVARFQADAPVTTSAAPLRIALAPERRGSGAWSVRGPAESLWAAARLQDQSLEGQLDGEGELQFGAGYLSGAGHLEIVDGRFEDKFTGVTLVDLDARIAINDRGVQIENFTAADPRGGRLTATGGSANNRSGSIVVRLADIRVADRPEARARADGELRLAWEGLNSSLSGQINILEANLDIASNPEAGIPTLDVVEINRPGYDDEPLEDDDVSQRSGATTLDVRVRAPGRVFTRGRGVDAEWSLDLRLAGTARDPRVFGAATAVRGTIALSGQPFEIDEPTRIVFNGDPLDARIDLRATRETADLTAYLRLTGTARDPEISFTSNPALPEDEILPQILFGRSVGDLSGLEAAQLAGSLAALSGNGALNLMDAARAAAGLDRFAVRQDEDGGFLVAGGVYLTRDVYLEVARTGLGQAQTRVEWTLRPRLVLITSFLGNGDQRVSLRWRRESD